MSEIIHDSISFVKQQLVKAEGSHDWLHTERVWKTAMLIGPKENADMLVVQLGAIFHDVADSKFHNGDEEIGPRITEEYLKNNTSLEQATIEHICNIVRHISYKGGHSEAAFKSKELDVVRDADRLDALGAIGIARCFSYGGYKKRAIYDPDIQPNMNMTKDEYKNSDGPSINHFFEKLLNLKQLMVTEKGRELANKRHHFIEQFLHQFMHEIQGFK